MHANHHHDHDGNGIANPHERVSFKHEIFEEDLAIDTHPKSLFIDKWQFADAPAQRVDYTLDWKSRGNTLTFTSGPGSQSVEKKISLKGSRLVIDYDFAARARGIFSVELNLAMQSCDGPAGRFRMNGEIIGGFGQPQEIEQFTEIWLEDEVMWGKVRLSSSQPLGFRAWPHFSVSQSEAGFEKIMQAVTIVLDYTLMRTDNHLTVSLEVIK